MNRTPISPDLDRIPPVFHQLLISAAVYDSSCSQEAQVLYIDKDDGYFLKSAPGGTLRKEADLTAYFHAKELAAEVLAYESLSQDWLLTRKVPGEDCIHPCYLSSPERLCDTTGELLRRLHELDSTGCPVPCRTESYLKTAINNCKTGTLDISYLLDRNSRLSVSEARTIVESSSHLLKADTLLHGDYCLPNIILDNWRFSGFIDLDCAGVGDRHIDLYWGLWSLRFNLKTDRYTSRFLDAYGRDRIDRDVLDLISIIEAFG